MIAKISFDAELPDGLSLDDAEAWIRFHLNDLCELRFKNLNSGHLLHGIELEPVYDTLLIDFEEVAETK